MSKIFSIGFLMALFLALSFTITDQIASAQSAEATRIDLIVEANTTVPLFYNGRALPSPGSLVRLIVVPDLPNNPKNLTYHWTVEDSVLFGGAIAGQNVVTFIAPKNRTMLVRVEVFDQTGKSLGKQLKEIAIAKPELVFYENNPLRGLSTNAIKSPHLLIAKEMKVRAEPYYMSKQIPATDLLTEWKINHSQVDNPGNNPQEIILRHEDTGAGRFNVSFHIRNLKNYIQGVENNFTVTF